MTTSSAKELYAVFEGEDPKTRKFLGYTRAFTQKGATNNIARRELRSANGLFAELATEELDKEIKKKKGKALPPALWEVISSSGVRVGGPTQAVSTAEAVTNVWFGKVKPDIRHPSDAEKASRAELVARPIFGQDCPTRPIPRKKKTKVGQGRLFAK